MGHSTYNLPKLPVSALIAWRRENLYHRFRPSAIGFLGAENNQSHHKRDCVMATPGLITILVGSAVGPTIHSTARRPIRLASTSRLSQRRGICSRSTWKSGSAIQMDQATSHDRHVRDVGSSQVAVARTDRHSFSWSNTCFRARLLPFGRTQFGRLAGASV